MNNEWINETCEDCRFQIKGNCRKGPPTKPTFEGHNLFYYSQVSEKMAFDGNTYFQLACSQYERRGNL